MALKFLNDGYFASKVGIGVESPTRTLQVNSGGANIVATFESSDTLSRISFVDSNTSSDAIVQIGADGNELVLFAGGAEHVRVDSAGNVGIGTSSPSVQLDIEDSSNVLVDMNTTTANANTTIRLQESGSVKATIGYDGTNDGLILTTGGFTAGNGIFIDDSQNVGIGTASPDRKLHVNSGSTNIVATFESTDATAAISLQDNSTTNDSKVQIRAIGDDFNIVAGGSQRVTVNSSGNVGIGTTSPGSPLSVVGSYSSSDEIVEIGGGTGINTDFKLKIGAVDQDYIWFQSVKPGDNYYDLVFNPTAGNVGIGTTSPNAKLVVKGGGLVSQDFFHIEDSGGIRMLEVTSDGAGNSNLQVKDTAGVTKSLINSAGNSYFNGGNVGIGTTSPSYRLTAYGSSTNSEIVASFGSANDQNEYTAIGLSGFIASNGATKAGLALKRTGTYGTGELHFLNNNTLDNSDMTLSDSKMMINSSGNVGIGDTGPNVKLQVSTSSPTNNVAVSIGDGWVGNSSYHKEGGLLLVSGTSQDATQTGAGIAFQTRNTGNTNYWKSSMIMGRDGAIRFTLGGAGTVAGSEDFTILSGGNVGIGTTSPGAKLHISEDSAAQLYLERTGSITGKYRLGIAGANNRFYISDIAQSADRFVINENGNVGIGTDSPTQKLHVAGNARVTGAYYDSNNSPGAANQVLVSTVSGTDWVDGSGSSIIGGPYLLLAGNTTATAMTGDIILANQKQLRFLTSANTVGLRLQSSGTSSFIDNEVGDMYIRQEADGNNIFFQADDGSGGNDTYFSVRPSNGARTQFEKNTRHQDDIKAFFGNGDDLQIYHDGSNSYIDETGTGDLFLKSSNDIYLQGANNEFMAEFSENGSVDLYYNGSKKLETTSTGVSVTGDIQIDSALLSNQNNTDVDTGTETVANVAIATYTAAFFDFVIKKTTNVRSGTVYACHDGTNVEFTETSTQDLGDTSDVTLSVDISGGNMRLRATTTSDDWSVKSLIKAI